MKKIVASLISFSILSCVLAQDTLNFSTETPKLFTREDYLKKYKSNKAGALTLTITGSSLMVSGVFVIIVESAKTIPRLFADTGEKLDERNFKTGTGLLVTGALLLGSSIPCYIYAKKYKKQYMTMSLHNEYVPRYDLGVKNGQYYPAIQWKITF